MDKSISNETKEKVYEIINSHEEIKKEITKKIEEIYLAVIHINPC